MNRKRVLAHSTDFPGRTHHRQGSCSTCSEKSPGRWGISSDLSADRWCPSSVCLPYLALSRELEDDVRIELNPSCNGQSAFEAVPTPGRFIIHGARGRIRTSISSFGHFHGGGFEPPSRWRLTSSVYQFRNVRNHKDAILSRFHISSL